MKAALIVILFLASFASAADFSKWERFKAGGHPDYALVGSLDVHLAWCVWHEGVPFYEKRLSISEFKKQCISKQSHNGHATSLISGSSNNEIRKSIDKMSTYFNVAGNGGYEMVRHHLSWVLMHEGRRPEVLDLLSKNDFHGIREIYQAEQEHNPHAHYLIQAVSDDALNQMLDDM